ncbi:hypothetical protein [Chroococcidiopsis sp. SAG 2025]|uniref:hypothetical protein n=1 Tax=Chroococcidiopsis sp. SAG 2025 TaxID=171389 RepID=UPI0029370C36|nr:hypothetical protein [Chroococcidiopsis sp. SAG 2025]
MPLIERFAIGCSIYVRQCDRLQASENKSALSLTACLLTFLFDVNQDYESN